jgi:hypothetical protein
VDEPLTVASYSARPPVKAYLEYLAVGGLLPEMPVFLSSDRYIPVPLEATHQAAYRGVPVFWRAVAGRPPGSGRLKPSSRDPAAPAPPARFSRSNYRLAR